MRLLATTLLTLSMLVPIAAAMPPPPGSVLQDGDVVFAQSYTYGVNIVRGGVIVGTIPFDFYDFEVDQMRFTPTGDLAVLTYGGRFFVMDQNGVLSHNILIPWAETFDVDDLGNFYFGIDDSTSRSTVEKYGPDLTFDSQIMLDATMSGPVAITPDGCTLAYDHAGVMIMLRSMCVPGPDTAFGPAIPALEGLRFTSTGGMVVSDWQGQTRILDSTGMLVNTVQYYGLESATTPDGLTGFGMKRTALEQYDLLTGAVLMHVDGNPDGWYGAMAYYSAPSLPPPVPELGSVLLVGAGLAAVAGIVLTRRK